MVLMDKKYAEVSHNSKVKTHPEPCALWRPTLNACRLCGTTFRKHSTSLERILATYSRLVMHKLTVLFTHRHFQNVSALAAVRVFACFFLSLSLRYTAG